MKFKRPKYNNSKIVIDGKKFDSKLEANYYMYLQQLEAVGDIDSFKWQVKYELQPHFKLDSDQKTRRAITYTADFVVNKNGIETVVDIKGSKFAVTQMFKMKKKMFEYKFGRKLTVITHNKRDGWHEVDM